MVTLLSRRLRAAWDFTPGSPLWRVHPPVEGRLIGEVRDPEARRASFFALDAATGRCLWRDRELHDGWWVAIERVAGDKLVLHGFASPDLPVPRGATVVDVTTGNIVWSQPDWTGDEAVLADAGVMSTGDEALAEVQFPVGQDPLDPELPQSPVAAAWPVDTIVGPFETAGYGMHTVAAAHVRSGQGAEFPFVHLLKVHDALSGKVVYEETLMAGAKGIAPDAFFIHDGMLFYIRERKTLCAVRIP